MGNWDDRSGGERWRDRGQGNWRQDRDGSGEHRGREQGRYGGHDDRGFLDRAGDEVRSWFGDDEAQRRRERDQRHWEQEQRMSGRRDNESGAGSFGGGGFGTGWGNQAGRSWNRERPGERGYDDQGRGGGERHYARGEREGWFTDSVGGERGERYGGGGGGGADYGSRSSEFFRGSGFGGDHERGRRFDRVDVGSTGTHGAHPMSAPLSGGFGDQGFGNQGAGAYGGGDAARYAAIRDQEARHQEGRRGGDVHDPHYAEWRRRQIEDLDRDYDEYRREHQSKFESEFGSWRSKRQGQRQALDKVDEHMEVVGSDGSHVGKVDKVRGDRIILAKSDPNAGGQHHSVPCAWVESVDGKVMLNKSAEEAMNAWRSEERSRALFEREGESGPEGSGGPRNLDRAFSGTYGEREGGDRGEPRE
ncbi:MAG: DUF2171 domain-containing protein [Allosphingosinicella sp.]